MGEDLSRQLARILFALGTQRTRCRRRGPSANRTGEEARTVDSCVRTFASRESCVVARMFRIVYRPASAIVYRSSFWTIPKQWAMAKTAFYRKKWKAPGKLGINE